MSEDRMKSIKDRFLGIIEGQLSGDLSKVSAKELGEIVDCAKDMAEMTYYCKITEAMEKNSDAENKGYMDEYLPESRYYTPTRMNMARRRDSRGRYMYTEPDYMMDDRYDQDFRSRMYYTNMHDPREGRSYISRRTYMEVKDSADKNAKMREMENYMNDLSSDLTEMIMGLDPTEKANVKTKLTQLASKIV